MKKQENSYESFNKYHKWNKNSKVYQEFENFSEEVIKNYKKMPTFTIFGDFSKNKKQTKMLSTFFR